MRPLTILTQRRYVLVTNGEDDPRDSHPGEARAAEVSSGCPPRSFVLAVCAFAGSALAPGGSGTTRARFAVSELARQERSEPARRAPEEGLRHEHAGEPLRHRSRRPRGRGHEPRRGTDLRALTAAAPRLRRARARVPRLRPALDRARARGRSVAAPRAGGRPTSRPRSRAWESTWSDYLHLGAVYLTGEAATLNQAIDGTPGGLPGAPPIRGFTGLHRIEMGLWSGASLHSLIGYDSRLEGDLERLRGVVAHVQITPLEYATRSHEIVEDAQRDLLSGMDVPWSGRACSAPPPAWPPRKRSSARSNRCSQDVKTPRAKCAPSCRCCSGVLESIGRRHHGRYPSLAELGQRRTRAAQRLRRRRAVGARGDARHARDRSPAPGSQAAPAVPGGRGG